MVSPNVVSEQFLSDEELTAFQRDGFHVARGLLSTAEVDKIRDVFMTMNKNGPVKGLSDQTRHLRPGEKTADPNDPLAFYPRMMHPHLHPDMPVGPIAKRYMLDGRLHPILRDLFGEEPVAVQSMFYFKPPGARGQGLHQDNFYLRVKPGTCMAAWIAIDDADEENGGMMVVRGTNDMEIACPEKADTTRYFTTEHVEPPAGKKPEIVDLKAGDVLFFNGSLIHGSNPNTSKTRFRRSLICHYVPAGSTSMSHWYTFPTKFDQTVVNIAPTTDGGPCGTNADAVKAPH